MSRQLGHYWVKIKAEIGSEYEQFEIGKYIGGDIWELTNSDSAWYKDELLVLSDRLEEPT